MRRTAALVLTIALGAAIPAQADDGDYLTTFLQDNLSSAGRKVTITGFSGALSSRATIETLEVADDKGVWIALDQVVLDWSQSSLLSGEIVINQLTAGTITLSRLPQAETSGLPAPEAAGFSLPDLPVSIEIGQIAAEHVVLGAPVLGEPLEARVSAALSLAHGEGSATLNLTRIDAGPASTIDLVAAYANNNRRLSIDLSATEEAGGIASGLLNLPGRPSTSLTLRGEGTLDDFTADFGLNSDDVARLAGPITIVAEAKGARRFTATLRGNPAPLFLPEYAGFLGDAVGLDVAGRVWPGGAVDLDRLSLQAQAVQLDGKLSLASDGLPRSFDLKAMIGAGDGKPVLLPLPGSDETRVTHAEINLAFDSANSDGWTGRAVLEDYDRAVLQISRAVLSGSGRIGTISGEKSLGATLDFTLEGLSLPNPAIASAIGTMLAGKAVMHWREGQGVLRLPAVELAGNGYAAKAALQIAGLDAALTTTGSLAITAPDLARFSALAGRPLGGTASIGLKGEASILSGAFDLALEFQGRALKAGIPEIDRLLSGPVSVTADAQRDKNGLSLRNLTAKAASLRFDGSGKASSGNASFSGQLEWADLSDLGSGLGGALSADAGFVGTTQDGHITLTGKGQNLRIGQPEIDRMIAGRADLVANAALADGRFLIESLRVSAPNLSAEIADTGGETLAVTGRLRDLALIAPDFPGPATLSGKITPDRTGYQSDLRIVGPAGLDSRINGHLGTNPDLTISGTADAAIANGLTTPVTLAGALRYDLGLRGGWRPVALSGRATLSGGKVALPARGLALERVAVAADLAAGRAQLTATAETPGGGKARLTGSHALTPPFDAGFDISVDRLVLRDPELYDTTASGSLRLDGPLLGAARLSGQLALGETELRIPSTGFASASDLSAITHINDQTDVRATRARAGIGTENARSAGLKAGGTGGPDWLLAINVAAPNRVFLRGRGLDAELGGAVQIGGSLRNVVPGGALELVRGRIDMLGKRLTLSEASLALEGQLVPFIRVVASNETDGVTSSVMLEGPADAPEVRFTSNPELPQEEVLAWLLFGRGLATISVLQAAQLANAVAVLAGRGGEGIVGRLRQGFGFDDLDITTAEDGTASVSAGKYISENVYTEIGVDQTGKSRINLNLDVRQGLTIKGRIDSDGESGIGIYLEKDY